MIELFSLIFTAIGFSYIGWMIGYKAGFEAGREHELDKAAQRLIRMSRFSNMQHKKNPCSPPLGSP